MAPRGRRRSALVRECSEEIAQSKEDAGESRWCARPKAVAEVSKQGHRQVHAQLGGDADDVHLELGVVQARLEEVAVQRVGGDAPCAEAVHNGPDEAQPSHGLALQALAVAVHDALGDVLEETAGVASVARMSIRAAAILVGGEEGATGRRVVELVDGIAAV